MAKDRSARPQSRYRQILERVFFGRYVQGATEVEFSRDDVEVAARDLGYSIRNIPDVLYNQRYRGGSSTRMAATAPAGEAWMIESLGKREGDSAYKFVLRRISTILPRDDMAETKVPDATPGIISMYSRSDEQALLATVRYNRLLDIFTGVTCYSLQSHLRSNVPNRGQVETDELYVGVDKRGVHYVFPVQAKGGRDQLSVQQIEGDIALCRQVWPALVCRPVAAQFIRRDLIALFLFEEQGGTAAVASERHYRLVPPEGISPEDLVLYATRPEQ